jgi:thiamine kinase-like enzyme
VERLRVAGYPAPRHEVVVLENTVVVLQEAVGGEWRDEVDVAFLELILQLNERQAGCGDAGDAWTDYIAATLVDGADGYCIHDTLRKHSPETSRLLSRIREIGAMVSGLPSGDIVHVDFHHRNMLRTGDELVAVIDWEGCKDGDRMFDLVTFAFGLPVAARDATVDSRLREYLLRNTDSRALAAYVAHMALRRIDWTIRHHNAVEAPTLIALADDYLAALA